MNRPEMILFDYGQTLVDEAPFCGVNGTRAVMRHAVRNKYGRTPEEVQAEANRLIQELEAQYSLLERPNAAFQNYLYTSQGIALSTSPEENEQIFWDAAAPGKAAPEIAPLLEELHQRRIRTGVLSNLSFSGGALRSRIDRLLPGHHFEFILASSDYLFRKPSRRFFELALELADLEPSQVWFCGNDVRCDIQGAQQAGLTAVWYTGCMDRRPDPPDGAFFEIGGWSELPGLLDRACFKIPF